MKGHSYVAFCFVLLSATAAHAQPKADEEAVGKLPQAFCDAWAKHDGHELAKVMAEDVDFVTVAATYLHGRAYFETFHVRLLSSKIPPSRPSKLRLVFYDPIWLLFTGVGKLKEIGIPMARLGSLATG